MADVVIRVVDGRAMVEMPGVPANLLAGAQAAAVDAGTARDQAEAAAAGLTSVANAVQSLPDAYFLTDFVPTALAADGDSFFVQPNSHTSGNSLAYKFGVNLGLSGGSISINAVSGRTSADGQADLFARDVQASWVSLNGFGQNDSQFMGAVPQDPRRYVDVSRQLLASHLWKGIATGANKVRANGSGVSEAGTWANSGNFAGGRASTTNGSVIAKTFTNVRWIVVWKEVRNSSGGRANIVINDSIQGEVKFGPELGTVITNGSTTFAAQAEYYDLGRVVESVTVQVVVTSPTGSGNPVGVVGMAGLTGEPLAGPLLAVCDLSDRGATGYATGTGSQQAVPIVSRLNMLAAAICARMGLRVVDMPLSKYLPVSTALAADQFHPSETGATSAAALMAARADRIQTLLGSRPDMVAQAEILGSTGVGLGQEKPVVLSSDGRMVSRSVGANALFFKDGDNYIPNKDGIRLCAVDAAGNVLPNKSIVLIHDGTNLYAQVVEGDFVLGSGGANRVRVADSNFSPETNDAISLGVPGKAFNYINISNGIYFNMTKVLGDRVTGCPPAATDAASTQTLVNFLRSAFITHGSIS